MPSPPLPSRTTSQRLRSALRGAADRVVLLWLILIALFVVFWQFLGRGDAPGAAPDAPPGGMWESIGLALLPLLPGAVVVGGLYLWYRGGARINKRGLDLMLAGDLAAAAEVFRGLAKRTLGPRAVAQVNLGFCLLRLGDLRGALAAFAAAERRAPRFGPLKPLIASVTAFGASLAGDLDAAARWAEEARRRNTGPAGIHRIHLAAEGIVSLRRGEAAVAARQLEASWAEIERCTSGDLVRGLRIVRAFATESSGGAASDSVNDLLAGARPFRKAEYSWLGEGWPEMARYLESKGLALAG